MNKNDKEPFFDDDYLIQFSKLFTKITKRKAIITQLWDGNVIITETKIRETVYCWNNELKKFVIKSKKII